MARGRRLIGRMWMLLAAMAVGCAAQTLGHIVNHVAENVAWMSIMSLSAPYPYSKRIQGVGIPQSVNGRPTWRIHSWDLT